MSKIKTQEEAAELVKDGAVLLLTGSGGGLMDADFLCEGIEKRFLASGRPKGLTLVHVSGIGNRKEKGVSRFAHKGMVRRVIGGHWGWSPSMVKLALDGDIEAYNLPQGEISLLSREIAAKRKGLLTRVGLHTFVDPRIEGGRLNGAAKEDLVEIVTVGGEELLLYKAFPVDVAVIRGTTADEDGNISMEQEAANLDVLSVAQAAYNSGGVVLAQVKRLVRKGQLHPRMVQVPGFMVSAVVVDPNQWQTCEGENNVGYSGEFRAPMTELPPLEFDMRKWVARRAAMELEPGAVVNLGFGIADGVANVAVEEKLFERIVFCIEQGLVGGVPAKGDIFGASFNPDAVLDAPYQFDFFHGGGLDMAFLGMAQTDAEGNINVSRFGTTIPGTGGFIDISQTARKVVFCGTFTAGGLAVDCREGRLSIRTEGKIKKFVPKVEQITFNGNYARRLGQEILYVTERAVFSLEPEGLTLVETAPGLDPERDVLAVMGFRPRVAKDLKTMDERIFRPDPMGLAAEGKWKGEP